MMTILLTVLHLGTKMKVFFSFHVGTKMKKGVKCRDKIYNLTQILYCYQFFRIPIGEMHDYNSIYDCVRYFMAGTLLCSNEFGINFFLTNIYFL